MHLLPWRGSSPRERGAVAAPLFPLRPVPLGDADETEDDRRGQRKGERGHEIEGRHRVDGVQELVDRASDLWLHLGDPPRCERSRGWRTEARMGRWVEADHRWLGLVTTPEEDLRRFWHELRKRELGGRGGIRLGVEKDSFDVSISCDDVVVDRRCVEDLRVAGKRPQHREGVGEEQRGQWVKVGMNGTSWVVIARHCLGPSHLPSWHIGLDGLTTRHHLRTGARLPRERRGREPPVRPVPTLGRIYPVPTSTG